jgi:hypothetical protein
MTSRQKSSPPSPTGTEEEASEETTLGSALLELVLANEAKAEPAAARLDGVVVGRLVALETASEPLVTFAESPTEAPLPARAMTTITPADIGREVALMFENGRADRPIVMGFMQSSAVAPPRPTEASADGKRLVFEADKEIVFRCGDASITLTRAGKIIIQGAYVLSRSTGVHRIQGGSVQIN